MGDKESTLTATEIAAADSLADPGSDVPQEPPSGEQLQQMIEAESLAKAEFDLRQQYAAAKVQYHLAKANVPGLDHPEQLKKTVKSLETGLEVVTQLRAKGDGIPAPSKLEVADKVPGGQQTA